MKSCDPSCSEHSECPFDHLPDACIKAPDVNADALLDQLDDERAILAPLASPKPRRRAITRK